MKHIFTLLTMLFISITTGHAQFQGGTGADSYPHLIQTAEQLLFLSTELRTGTDYDGHYFEQTTSTSPYTAVVQDGCRSEFFTPLTFK
jgi:hypothetical protein